VWVALEVDEETRAWGGRFLRVVGRLAPGADEAAADAELAAIAARRAEALPELNANWTAHAVPLREDAVGGVRRVLLVLLAAVAFLLLVACANVANLLIARAAARADELAVRAALGASRARLSRQLLAESLALGALAGAAGLLAGAWLADALPRAVPAELGVPRLDEVRLDPRVLAFTASVTLLTVVLFGWAPALLATRARITAGGERAVGGRGATRVRASLVVGQVAVVLVLLAGAGLMGRSLAGLARVDLGFDPDRVLIADVALPDAAYPEEPSRVAFFTALVERLSGLPGVRSAGAISFLPLSGERSATGLLVEGRPRPPPGHGPTADVRAVTPGYLDAMRIPLRAGRGILPSDAAGRPAVAVVGERLARTLFPGEDPIGRRIAYEWDEDVWVEIVGVAADVRHGGPATDPYLEVYLPLAQFPYARMSVVLRAGGDPAALAAAVRREVRLLDRDLPVARIRTLEVLAADAIGTSRLSALLLSGFGGLALLLALVGVYGVAAHGVTRRTRELGVRAALGAAPREMVLLVLREGAALALVGVTAGLAGAAVLTRLLAGLLYGVAPGDPATLLAAGAALCAATVAASLPPALRAARLDPVRALRANAS
jgi:predicted permease